MMQFTESHTEKVYIYITQPPAVVYLVRRFIEEENAGKKSGKFHCKHSKSVNNFLVQL